MGTGQPWEEQKPRTDPIACPDTADIAVLICVAGLLLLGLYPEPVLNLVQGASGVLFSN